MSLVVLQWSTAKGAKLGRLMDQSMLLSHVEEVKGNGRT